MSERQGNENTWYTNDEYLDRINHAFEVVEPINVKAGKIAPWFDESGGGIQYLLYQIWFAQNSILVNYKNAWGKTPLKLAEQIPYRKCKSIIV